MVFLLYRSPPFRYDISIDQNGDMDMTENRITTDLSASFARHLRQAERSPGTTENHLRHLFARCFYRVSRDVAKLADVLGHSSIETTRIYLISTGAEHARTLDQLRLIS